MRRLTTRQVSRRLDAKTAPEASGEQRREGVLGDSIIRVDKRTGRWEAIPRSLIEDERLSLQARWFAIWLASRSPDWEIRASVLPRLLKDTTRRNGHLGRDTTKRLLRELQRCGYLVRSRTRTPTGRWCWQSAFRSVADPTIAGFTVDGSSVDGKGVDLQRSGHRSAEWGGSAFGSNDRAAECTQIHKAKRLFDPPWSRFAPAEARVRRQLREALCAK